MVQAFGLDSQVDFPTHTLDLVLTEAIGNIQMSECRPRVFLSDHCSIESIFNVKNAKLVRKELLYRKIDAIDVEDFCNELDVNQLKALSLEDKSSNSIVN